MSDLQRNPYRILGIVFTSIAAAEAVVVLGLLVTAFDEAALIALPFAVQSVIFGGIGISFLVHLQQKKANREKLLANGYFEIATITGIEQNPFVRVNRRSPYHVVCRIERDGALHEYKSEGFYHHPGVQPGEFVPVYLDRQNEKNYYVDVESIAPRIIRH